MSSRTGGSSRRQPLPTTSTPRMGTPASSAAPLEDFNDWLHDLERRESLMDNPPATASAPPRPPAATPAANRWLARMKPHDEKVIAGLLGSLSEEHAAVEDVVNVLEGELRFAGDGVVREDTETEDGSLGDLSSDELERQSGAGFRAQAATAEVRNWVVCDPLVEPLARSSVIRQQPPRPEARAADVENEQGWRLLQPCRRCPILEQQVRMLVQAVAGLGACAFNWSARCCEESPERSQHWRDILKYTQPCAEIDDRIDAMCQGIQAAAGIVYELLAPRLQAARDFVDSIPRSPIPSYEHPASRPSPSEPPSPPPEPVHRKHFSKSAPPELVRELADEQHAMLCRDGLGSPDKVVFERADGGKAQAAFMEVTVRLEASAAGKKLSGVYCKVPGPKVNGRWVYARGRKYLLHLDDGTWVIKDGPGSNADAHVFAYTQDKAVEPYRVSTLWRVVADSSTGDGFVVDRKGIVMPGRRDAALLALVTGNADSKKESTASQDDPGQSSDMYQLAVDDLGWTM